MDQRSDEWFAARLGKVTASRVADIMARTKSGYSSSRANYMAELVAERLTGKKGEGFSSAAMQWGTEQEPFARAAYESAKGELVEEVGFVPHPRIDQSGASPDGLVSTEGLIEIKAPNSNTHLDFLMDDAIPEKYVLQMQWQMACTDRAWCDYVSFDPRMPERMQMKIKRVMRDNQTIVLMESEVARFLAELQNKISKLTALYPEK